MSGPIFWSHEPKWDPQNKGWYWEGQKVEGTHMRRVTIWLRPDEFGSDGYPLPNAAPPLPDDQEQTISTSPYGALNNTAPSLGHHSLNNPSSIELSNVPDLPSQFFTNYQSYDNNLAGGKPSTSTSRGRHHKKHSDRKSSCPQALSTHFEASLQLPSSQTTGYNDTVSYLARAPDTNPHGGTDQTQDVNLYSTNTVSWAAESGSAAPQSSLAQASAGFQDRYASNGILAASQYPAQVHQGASWAGGPSNGERGLAPIQVKSNALNKIKPVTLSGPRALLDPDFDVYPSPRFQPGKIIKVWWSEPAGMPTRGAFGSRLSKDTLLKDHQRAIWTGFRRFIIIRNFEGHCHGIPIYTYGGQGCRKHGVKHHEHGVIYEDLPGNTGKLLPNEKSLGCPSIRARTTNGEPMDSASRVNYAKVADIGHNLKVNFIAEVVPEDWDIAKNALRRFGFC